jgi:hypothetical protein
MSTSWISIVAVLVIAALGLGGYLAGRSQAPTTVEAEEARQQAELRAAQVAEEEACARSRQRAEEKGLAEGRVIGTAQGSKAGKRAGEADVGEHLAVTEPATPEEAGLVYDEQLPNGRPGYILPEEQRSISCIGIDAATGECVGD